MFSATQKKNYMNFIYTLIMIKKRVCFNYCDKNQKSIGKNYGKFLNTHFYPNYLKRWKLVNRSNERFLEKFKEWLNGNINISSDLFGSDPIASTSGNIKIINTI